MMRAGGDEVQALSKTQAGEICEIKWMFGLPEVLDFMKAHQIEEGSVIQVIQSGIGGLIIRSGLSRFAMSREIADRIQV